MMTKFRTDVRAAIDSQLKGEKVSWRQIVDEIAKRGIQVVNWVDVRVVLRGYIDLGMIHRTEDLRVEEYFVHPTTKNYV